MSGRWRRILLEGLVAGSIGYATVAVFFAVANLLQGRPALYTAALLGGELFYGLREAGAVVIAPGPVLSYNGAHLLAFLLAGTFAAWLVSLVERAPQAWYLIVILLLVVMPHVFGLPIWFAGAVRAAVPLGAVVLATSLAAVAMAVYLTWVHPRLRPAGGWDE